MTLSLALPCDQYDYLVAKSLTLKISVPQLVKNLLTYGRLTPRSCKPLSPRSNSFLPEGVKRLPRGRRATSTAMEKDGEAVRGKTRRRAK